MCAKGMIPWIYITLPLVDARKRGADIGNIILGRAQKLAAAYMTYLDASSLVHLINLVMELNVPIRHAADNGLHIKDISLKNVVETRNFVQGVVMDDTCPKIITGDYCGATDRVDG